MTFFSVSELKIPATISPALFTKLWMPEELTLSSPQLLSQQLKSLGSPLSSSPKTMWCLHQLIKILECKMRKTNKRIVIPVFYGVSPSDVRNQTRSLAVAFANHEERFKKNLEQVHKWKHALWEAANITGWPSGVYKGEDTSCNLTSHLYASLYRKGIKTFLDDEELSGVDELSSSLIVAISKLKHFYYRFIQDYANSRLMSARHCVVDDFSSTWDGVGEKSKSNDDGGIVFFYNGVCRRIGKYWRKVDLLGRGSFGTVYNAINEDGFVFAVKEVSLLDQSALGKKSVLQLQQEIYILSQFEHENIVRYFGTSKDKNMLCIFLELVKEGSLANLYQKCSLSNSQVSAYTRQILNALKYLHDRNVIHRDIKCANILVDANGSVKLADFGLARATETNAVKSFHGTAFWMAPEVVKPEDHGYGLAADIWSLGCTVLEMLTGQHPYPDLKEGVNALCKLCNGEPPPVPDTLSGDAQDFILKCIQVNPNDRPTAVQLLDHPFIKER